MPYGDGGMLEDRLLSFLDMVPIESIERELARIAPACVPHSMSCGEVIRTLGVAGIAALAGVRRSTVLESAGPEACSLADLVESNPYGHFQRGSSCGPCRGSYGPSAPGLGLPATFSDPGYGLPIGYERAPQGTPIGYERAPVGTPIGYSRAPAAAPIGYATGAGTARYAAAPNDYRTGAAASFTMNPGGLTAAQEAAINQAIAAGHSPEEIETIHEEFQSGGTGGGSSAGSVTGWPGAVPFRPDAWNFSEGWYILQADDTFSGLASTYLQSPARWREIWERQPYRYTKAPDPSSASASRPLVRVGERVEMPPEATARAKELFLSGAPRAPAIGGTGGTPKGAGAPWSLGAKVALGAAVVGVAAVGAYALA